MGRVLSLWAVGKAAIGGAIGGALFGVGGGPDSYQGLLGSVSDGFGAALTTVFGKLGPYVQAGVSGAIGNALTQGAGMLFGMQKKFSWREVAASAVAGTVGYGAGKMLNPSAGRSLGNLAKRTLNGVITGAAHASVTGGKIHFEDIVTDAFGNAIGNSIVESIQFNGRVKQYAKEGLTYGRDKNGTYFVTQDAEGNDYRSYSRGRFADALTASGNSVSDVKGSFGDTSLDRAFRYSDAADYVAMGGSVKSRPISDTVNTPTTDSSDGLEEIVVTANLDRIVTKDGRELNLGVVSRPEINDASGALGGNAVRVLGYGADAISAFSEWSDRHPFLANAVVTAGSALIGGGGLKVVVKQLAGSAWDTVRDQVHGAVSNTISGAFQNQMATSGYTGDLVGLTGQLLGEVGGTVTDAVFGGNVLVSAKNVRGISEDVAEKYARPSGYRKGVRDQVWEDAAKTSPGGIVRDPLTGRVMSKDEPWDMGHLPGKEFRKIQAEAAKQNLTRKQFLDIHNDPKKYRPELPSSNRSHKLEDMSDDF